MLTRKNVSGYTLVEAVVVALFLVIALSAVGLVGSVIYYLLTH